MLEEIIENRIINQIVRNFKNSPIRIHQTHAADAEILDIDETSSFYLTATIDSISEEIHSGLYQDPFLMGWMLVMANFSDLAAVGASPAGILVSLNLPSKINKKFHDRLMQGISEACQELGTFVLGGDTNSAPEISLTGCALGLVTRDRHLSRIGCQEGDVVFLSGLVGSGSALGLVRFANFSDEYYSESAYRPIARVNEGKLIRNYASCCMDTSDGVLTTLDQLMRLNKVGFAIDSNIAEFLHPAALQLSTVAKLPNWMMLAGHHGEFELLFTVPEKQVEVLLTDSKRNGWTPIKIGTVIHKPSIKLPINNELNFLDTKKIRNLFAEFNGNIKQYIKELIQLENNRGKGIQS